MNQTHFVPEIYNPDIPYAVKCKIMAQLCRVYAAYRNVYVDDLKRYLLEKIHVDFDKLENNPVGMLLLYEYLYFQRPKCCLIIKK